MAVGTAGASSKAIAEKIRNDQPTDFFKGYMKEFLKKFSKNYWRIPKELLKKTMEEILLNISHTFAISLFIYSLLSV